ncbi:MAG: phosphoribosylglycinamide synthetase C domain-containing protein, partial [Halomonas sp.]
ANAEQTGCKVFHAGTAQNVQGEVTTAGGRVLCVTALGNSVSEAQQQAYQGVSAIQWAGVEYRRDIAFRAIAREG